MSASLRNTVYQWGLPRSCRWPTLSETQISFWPLASVGGPRNTAPNGKFPVVSRRNSPSAIALDCHNTCQGKGDFSHALLFLVIIVAFHDHTYKTSTYTYVIDLYFCAGPFVYKTCVQCSWMRDAIYKTFQQTKGYAGYVQWVKNSYWQMNNTILQLCLSLS